MKTAILLILATATTALAAGIYFPETPMQAGQRRRPKIVGGVEAKPHTIPYQAGLFLDGSFCGASLITKRYALTAAHCTASKNAVVVLGSHRINDNEPEKVLVKAKKLIPHPKYNFPIGLANDIAIVELAEEVELNENIQVVKLADSGIGSLEGETAQVSGWGLAYSNATNISPVLRVVESTLMNNDDCAAKFGFPVQKTVVCLDGSKKKGACNGDSGGPLVIKTKNGTVQVGVVSYGSSAGCEKGYPTAYTRVASYLDWLKKNTDYE
ncbi:hypothetical protein RUM44_010808 [Polyplax serrata]|uniref:Peptidase S1 domain-containing protein n=1 Tax=Polyplax serrata TaxID=468196 RepID=A0ABR1AN83_POLSC